MKIRNKLLMVLVATTVVVCALLGVWGSHLLGRSVRDSTIARLDRELTLMSAELSATLDGAALTDFAHRYAEGLDLRVTLIAADGVVLADSAVDDVSALDNHLGRPEVRQALAEGRGESFRRSDTTRLEYYYRAERVGRGRVGVVRLAFQASDLDQFQLESLLLLLLAILGALILLSSLAWYAVGRLSRPVERIARSAERVAAGELDTEIPDAEDEELSRLAASVDRMRASLVSRVEEIGAERGLFRTMTEGLDEGLLLTDANQNVLLVNGAFRQIFRLADDPVDRALGQVLPDSDIVKHVEQCLDRGEDLQEVVSGPAGTNRSFELHVSRVDLPGGRAGVLALLFDTTRQEALEQVRQRFIADVSHELRTPVTSIKGAIETLLDSGQDVGELEKRFLEIASRQADRMTELIADLTDLSRIETGAIALEKRVVDLSSLTREVIEGVASRHAGRDITLHSRVSEGFTVFADGRRLEQVLVNLVDNGLKYTPDGGVVRVAAERVGDYDVISVEDTGPGIPPQDREKVFNRFYRVDKARSRELGGTGLGLAIVKHLVTQHHGSVRVEDAAGGGARFVVELPRHAKELS